MFLAISIPTHSLRALECMRPAHPVSRILFPQTGYPAGGQRSFLWDTACVGTSSDLPGSIRRAALNRSPIWSCTGWGLPSFPGRPGNWCALTAPFHPYQTTACLAVCSLWHFPSRCRDSTLWSTLPCGVRTFLRLEPAIVWITPAACNLQIIKHISFDSNAGKTAVHSPGGVRCTSAAGCSDGIPGRLHYSPARSRVRRTGT